MAFFSVLHVRKVLFHTLAIPQVTIWIFDALSLFVSVALRQRPIFTLKSSTLEDKSGAYFITLFFRASFSSTSRERIFTICIVSQVFPFSVFGVRQEMRIFIGSAFFTAFITSPSVKVCSRIKYKSVR